MRSSKERTEASRSGSFKNGQEWGKNCFEDLDQRRMGRPATRTAEEQYKSLLTGLQAVGQVKGWKVQQVVFVGGPCGSIHVESFNRNMKALGVLASKWDPIRTEKLVRRLLEEQDKVLRSYFAQKGGTRSKGGDRGNYKGREHVQHVCVKKERIAHADPS